MLELTACLLLSCLLVDIRQLSFATQGLELLHGPCGKVPAGVPELRVLPGDRTACKRDSQSLLTSYTHTQAWLSEAIVRLPFR